MQTVRTTITFPEELHQKLLVEAVTTKKTLSKLVVEKLGKRKRALQHTTMEMRIRRGRAFFDRVARMGKPINAVQAVREERER